MQPRIYLVSCAGHPNYGDELITASWLRHLAEELPETEVWLDCPNPGMAAELFFGLHPNAHFTNTLWRVVWDRGNEPGAAGADEVARIVTDLGSPAYDLALLRLREMDSFHLLGGGYLNSIWPLHLRLINALLAVRELTGAALYATGISLAPLEEEDHACLPALRSFDHVSVRDTHSADLLGLDVGLDDALLGILAERDRGRNSPVKADVVVCLQRDLVPDDDFSAMVQEVRTAVSAFKAKGQSVVYAEAIPGVDHPGFDALSDLIPPENFIPFLSVWRDGLPTGAHTWITTRFHLHLLASAMGAAGTAIGVKPGYYDVKHGSLLELGTGWAYVSAGQELPEASHRSGFPRAVKGHAKEKKREALSLYRRGSAFRGRR